MEEVIDAAKKSNIHGFVARLPQGYVRHNLSISDSTHSLK